MFATILCEAKWFSTCFLAVLKVTHSVLLPVISLFCCLFFLDLLLMGCFSLEISPLLGCPTFWHITAYKQSLMVFCVSVLSVTTSLSLLFWVLSSPWCPTLVARGLLILFFQKKKKTTQLVVLLNSSIISLICIIYLLSDLNYFLPSDDVRFCYSFSNSFRW